MRADPRRINDARALLEAEGRAFARTARRFSLCADDADDALQRATVILLTKAPAHPTPRLTAWMHLVTRREALAVRRERERLLGADATDRVLGARPSAAELVLRRERSRERASALRTLKPAERRAIVLRAEGYSYAEICELTGWSYTKVNRALSEGRARLRRVTSGN